MSKLLDIFQGRIKIVFCRDGKIIAYRRYSKDYKFGTRKRHKIRDCDREKFFSSDENKSKLSSEEN